MSLTKDHVGEGTCVARDGPSSYYETSVDVQYPERIRSLEEEHVEKVTCPARARLHVQPFLERRVEKVTCGSRDGTLPSKARVCVQSPELLRSFEKSMQEGTCVSHGSISLMGRRRKMEDEVVVEEGFISKETKKYDFFGIYGGHGGTRVVHACRQRLHEMIVEEVEEGVEDGVVDWEKVMKNSFRKMDDEVNRSRSAVAMMGSTVVVAVVGEEEVVVAICGDSKAVLYQDSVVVVLSNDHKPDRPDKFERIEHGGGKVINWNGQRVLGVLATSRSIDLFQGGRCLKPFVTSEPEVRVMRRTEKDEFIILASDGLWDVISNELACEVVKRCIDGQLRNWWKNSSETCLSHAAALLAELAISRGSRDNISVIVVELQRFRCLRG